MATAWGLAYTVTHHARTLLNAATVEDWDLDTLDEDDYARRTAIIYNGWMAGEAFLLASGIKPRSTQNQSMSGAPTTIDTVSEQPYETRVQALEDELGIPTSDAQAMVDDDSAQRT